MGFCMRKASILLIIAAVLVSLIGCLQTDETGGNGSSDPTSSFSAGESSTTPTATSEEESAATTEPETSSTELEQSATSVPASQNQTSSSKPTEIQPTTPPTPTQPPATSSPTEQPKPTESSKPTETPATSTPAPTFDPQPYVDYAISYGKSIGLKYESAVGTGNWNSPLNLYASLTDEQMKTNIRSACDILVREDCEYFWVSAVKQQGDSYQLFIYYG